jgi:hypothetical protein
MTDRIKAVVSRKRDVNMFGELYHGHRLLLGNTNKQRDGHTYEAMSCLIVGAFKFEAFLNDIGTKLLPFWEQIERIPHKNKLALIAEQVGVTVDYSCRPFKTLKHLFEARNQLAHAKPQTLSQESIIESGTREEIRRRKPLTKWELLCTADFAQQAFYDTEAIADLLWGAAGFSPHELRATSSSYEISDIPT